MFLIANVKCNLDNSYFQYERSINYSSLFTYLSFIHCSSQLLFIYYVWSIVIILLRLFVYQMPSTTLFSGKKLREDGFFPLSLSLSYVSIFIKFSSL